MFTVLCLVFGAIGVIKYLRHPSPSLVSKKSFALYILSVLAVLLAVELHDANEKHLSVSFAMSGIYGFLFGGFLLNDSLSGSTSSDESSYSQVRKFLVGIFLATFIVTLMFTK